MTVKFYSLLILTGILFQGCMQDDFNQLKKENNRLQKELKVLHEKIDNSIVIPQDEIDKYIYPMTFSQYTGKTNNEFQFETFLVLGDLPKNINWQWNSTPEPMKMTNENLRYTVTSFYENPRLMNYDGNYILTFPNKKTTTFYWSRKFEIVN